MLVIVEKGKKEGWRRIIDERKDMIERGEYIEEK